MQGVRVGGGKQRGVGALCCLWKDELGQARREERWNGQAAA